MDDVCNFKSNSNSIYLVFVSYRNSNSIEPIHWGTPFLWMMGVMKYFFKDHTGKKVQLKIEL